MNTLYVFLGEEHLYYRLRGPSETGMIHDFVQTRTTPSEKNLLRMVLDIERHYGLTTLVWCYSSSAPIVAHCYAMALLERLFGTARHLVAPDMNTAIMEEDLSVHPK